VKQVKMSAERQRLQHVVYPGWYGVRRWPQ